MRKWKRFTALIFLLMLAHMALIFAFSCQSGQQSGETSGKVVQVAAQLFVPGYGEMTKEEKALVETDLQFPIRKLGHFLEYALLGLWAMLFFSSLSGRRPTLYALALSVLYAAGDEFHQSFVDGRGPAITDVLIDSAGALAGIFLVLLIQKLRKKKRA